MFTRLTSTAYAEILSNTATAGIPELIEPISANRKVTVTAPAVTGGGTGGRPPTPSEEEVVIPPAEPLIVPLVISDEEVIIEVDEVPL